MSQCYRCAIIGRATQCDLCTGTPDPNQQCPQCARATLIRVGDELGCDHCSYRRTTAAHKRFLEMASLRLDERAAAAAEATTEAKKLSAEIKSCYRETTKRRTPGGNDATGTSKEDKLSGTTLMQIRMQSKYSEGIVGRRTEVLDPKDKILRVTGCDNPGSKRVRQAIDRLFADLVQWKVADTFGVGACERLGRMGKQ